MKVAGGLSLPLRIATRYCGLETPAVLQRDGLYRLSTVVMLEIDVEYLVKVDVEVGAGWIMDLNLGLVVD